MSQQFTIYVGLNDSKTRSQKFETDKYLSILKNICRSYQAPFSFQLLNGGYFHEDGQYVEENTLMLMLIDVSEQIVAAIAEDLCVFFNQESVMVVDSPVSVIHVKEKLL